MSENADSQNDFFIPAEIQQEAQEATLRLLPKKSKSVYEKELMEFDNWRKSREVGKEAIAEEVLLSYFFHVKKRFAASSMWTKYSMLKSMLKVHKCIDISKYGRLTSYLKAESRWYKPKKAKILERNQIEEFLKKASDEEYLQVKVAWVRAEDQTILSLHTKVVTHNSRISVTHDSQRTWQIRIRQLKESDRGCYMCQINTSVLKIQQGCIDVNVPPDIINDDTSGDLSVLEGDNTTLWCKATGHPRPKIVWKREDGHPIFIRKESKEIVEVDTYNGSNLYFWRLDRRQMGAYLCIASNDVPPAVSKRIALSVNFAPTIKVPNQLLGAPLNTDVLLECYVEAYPNTINYWLKNRGEMLLNGTRYTIHEERTGFKVYMSMIVRFFSPKDVGTYNCVSTNSLGRAEGTLRLYEIKVGHGQSHDYVSIIGGVAESARSHISRDSNGSSSSSFYKISCTFNSFIYFLIIYSVR